MTLDGRFSQVLAAACSGDEAALTALYVDLHPRVLRYLQAHEPSAAEDLASDVWLAVAEGLHRFSGGEDDFRAWIFTIARRRMLDLRRRAARRRTVTCAPAALPSGRVVGNVEHEAMEALATDAAVARLATLPPDQREVLLLRVVAGLGAAEVAQILGKRRGAVRVLQHRALRRLAAELSPQEVAE
jgi:RNA polymerase sigma-70 factor (ECF subfamily)